MRDNELGTCLRAWRERLDPVEVGLPRQGGRRTPGLRREELSRLAGLSVDYLARVEQGRASNPSPQVLEALARALRLSEGERDHLFRLAGHMTPAAGMVDRHMTPGIQRMLDRLADTPVLVFDASWEMVGWNQMAAALLGEPSPLPGRERNIAWRQFTGATTRIVRSDAERRAMDAELVADLHAALARFPEDEKLRCLIADLRSVSDRFDALWRRRPVALKVSRRKTIDHPQVGLLSVDCDVLVSQGSNLRIVVYSAPPGSPDAEALALIGVIGLQDLEPR